MYECLRQAGESSQIQDSKGVNVEVLNAPHRLLSSSELFMPRDNAPDRKTPDKVVPEATWLRFAPVA
jgi:hypothetical protein